MMDDSPQHSTNISRVFITKETVANARMTLPPARLACYDVMEVEVMSVDRSPAMIEFERIRIFDESGQSCWSWEATTCWAT
jgi:hypothetical protein